MTDDLINRARLALEGYHKDHRAFGAEIARDSLGLCACDLLPEVIEEIKRLEAKANQMVADKINLRSELLSVQAKLAVAVEALDRMRRGWENLVELELIDPKHAFTATLLQKEARAALAEIKGEGDG